MKKKIILILAIFACCGIIYNACKDNDCQPTPRPKWELPQPIDTLLLGSWEAIESDDFDTLYSSQIITFNKNNKCINKVIYFLSVEEFINEYLWSVNSDTLLIPDFFDDRTGHFASYTYSLSTDKKLLHLNFINYPFVNKGDCYNTDKAVASPFGYNRSFKRLEELE